MWRGSLLRVAPCPVEYHFFGTKNVTKQLKAEHCVDSLLEVLTNQVSLQTTYTFAVESVTARLKREVPAGC